MSAADAAAEILRRERENPGSVPPALLAKAQALGGSPEPGVMTLPEQEIRPTPGYKTSLYGQIVGGATDEQLRRMDEVGYGNRENEPIGKILGAGAVAANEFANAALLGIPQATGYLAGDKDPGYAAAKQDHPIAALGGQIGGLMAPGNPANMAARGIMGAIGAAATGLAGSVMGRTAMGAGEGALAGGAGAGTITAAGGGSSDQIFNSAATGAGIGGVLGAGGRLLAEPGRWLRGLLQSRGGPPNTGQMLPPAGPPGVSGPPKPMPLIPDLEMPARPEPVAASAPHEPTEPLPDLSTVHRPGPGDTGMGAEEARRALDSEALHMANRTAAVSKLVDIIPPGADASWLSRMTAEERGALADFVGVQQAEDDIWRAVADALDRRASGPTTRPAEPLPRESQLAREARLKNEHRQQYLNNRPPLDSASPTARIGPSPLPPPPIPSAPRLPNMNPDILQLGLGALQRGGLRHGPLGIDPMLGALLQSPQFTNAAGMAGGSRGPQMTNRQVGAPPIDILSLYGM